MKSIKDLFKRTDKKYWKILTAGAGLGALASFIQLIERISWADKPDQILRCNINSVFSCSSVFDAWQSSVFGFSNTIMCLLFFGVMLGVGLTMWFSDGKLNKNFRLVMQFLSVFFLIFGYWYLSQSALSIGALCVFCIFCYIGVIAVNYSWLRLNVDDLPLSRKAASNLKKSIEQNNDIFGWALLATSLLLIFLYAFL